MRLIDADAAKIKILEVTAKMLSETPETSANAFVILLGLANMFDCEYDFPTVEAEPVKHSMWIKDEDQPFANLPWMCEECNESFPVRKWGENLMNYCPNCGAKMDGGSK